MANQNNNPGEALRALRIYAGLSMQQVADGAGTAIAYLSKVERGMLVPAESYVKRITQFIASQLGKKADAA